MRLYPLGPRAWTDTQLIYHALARLGREGLVLTWPQEPYVCLGYHQDHRLELDRRYCVGQGLPVFRREVGGGAVYLDRGQVFWELVLRRDNPLVPLRHDVFYRRFLDPVIAACHGLGIGAELLGLNDLAVDGQRITGTGAGEIGQCIVFVGNLILEPDHHAMARVLQAPSRIFSQELDRAVGQGLTGLNRVAADQGLPPLDNHRVSQTLAAEFARLLGPLTEAEIDADLAREVERQAERMLDPAWLDFPRKPGPGRTVKIRAGMFLTQRRVETPAGKLGLVALVDGGRLERIIPLDQAWGRAGQAALRGLIGLTTADLPREAAALADQLGLAAEAVAGLVKGLGG